MPPPPEETVSESAVVAAEDTPKGIFYVDLLLGAWRPREAALQLAVALDIQLPPEALTDPETTDIAMTVGAIDIAAKGDAAINQAWSDAALIAGKIPEGATIVVLAPRFGQPLRADNEWLFVFLRRLEQELTYIGDEPAMTATGKAPFQPSRDIGEPDWPARPPAVMPEHQRLLRLFPGLLPRAIATRAGLDLEALVPVGATHFLIPAVCRDTDPRDCPRDFDALEEIEAEDDGFKALAQTFCTSHFADPDALMSLGRRHFKSGSRDLARHLVMRARTLAGDPASVAATDLMLREMDFCEGKFAEIVAAPRLSPRAPAGTRERMRALRDAARLETGDLIDSAGLVNSTLKRLGADKPIEAGDILCLERIVEARRRAGDSEGALSLAASIAAALGPAGPKADQRLVFANAMSLAGLHTARGAFEAASREIERGFATSLGARDISDIFLMNVMCARAEPIAVSPAAARCWLRAGLIWLCHQPREGWGRTAVEAVLGSVDILRPEFDNDMSNALASALAAAWPSLASAEPGRLPSLLPPASVQPATAQSIYAGPGAAVIWTGHAFTAPPPTSARAALTRLVCAALGEICPPFRGVDSGTITIDTNLGTDIPDNRQAALTVALRSTVEDFWFGEDITRLDSRERNRLGESLEVRLSPVVGEISEVEEGIVVRFKRYLPSLTLAGTEARLVGQLRNGRSYRLTPLSLIDGIDPAELEPILRRLETARIVRIEFVARPPAEPVIQQKP